MHDWNMWHGGGADWMWWVMMIGLIVLWIGVIALVVWLVKTWTSGHAVSGTATGAIAAPVPVATPVAGGTEDTTIVATGLVEPAPSAEVDETPRQILDRRYAAGDIDREDYLQRKADLE